MTSCPSEEELVLFVEDGLPEEQSGDVADHVIGCADCRRLVARSEAALRYALGGMADRERAMPVPADVAPRRVLTWPRAAAAVAAAAAIVAGIVVLRPDDTRAPHVAVTPAAPLSLSNEIDVLLARVERLAVPEAPESDIALAALAAAEARLDLGMPTAEARLQDVVERFAGTPEAREARARLASLGTGR